jgi:hypothetical protein
MQFHHDEIDKQLLDQNTLLNSLQETLRKEVDDFIYMYMYTYVCVYVYIRMFIYTRPQI